MYLEHYQLKQDPFLADPEEHIFFPGGGRGIVLQHVLEDLFRGINLVHLSGERGSGKTLMCQIIREKLRFTETVVLLLTPSSKIDKKGHCLTLVLEESDAEHIEGATLYEKLLLLISDSADSRDSILLIIDDAEKLPSTVLTQILRLDRDVQPHIKMQVILAGRLPLGVNPDQFAAIRDEGLQQFTYTLQPLDCEDTANYLAFRLTHTGIGEVKKNGIFSIEAIDRIHELTCGNIGSINTLAQSALHNACKSKSSIVFADHVRAPSDISAALPISINRPSEARGRPLKILAGIIVLLIVAAVLTYNMVLVDNKFKERIDQLSSKIQEIPLSLPDKLPASSTTQEIALSQSEEIPVSSPVQVESPPLSVVVAEEGENAQIQREKDAEEKPVKAQKTIIVPIIASQKNKIRHKVEGRIDMSERVPPKVSLDGRFTSQEIYKKRTAAGGSWIKGEKNGMYTLQMMVLKASTAEANMKKKLDEKRYRQHAHNLYIFRKGTASGTVFVFYGEYKSIAAARLAQRSIPGFLRAHQPYVISIDSAMAKIRK